MDNEPVKRKRGRPPKNAPKVVPELVSKPKRKRRTAEQIHEDFTAKQAKLLKVDKSAKKKSKQKDEKHCIKESSQKPQVLIFNTDKKILEEKKEKSSQVKTEFDENDESSNEASMVEKDDDIRSFNYRTTIPEQPKILKKFRPPMSKYKLRELEALAAAEESIKIADDVATTGAASLRKKLPSTLDLDSYTSSDSFFSCSSEIQPTTPLSHFGVEPPNNDIAKFCQLNAWLASKQSRWCVKTKLSLNKMLYKESLIATFKCMARNCSFTTISIKNFKKHLAHHEAESDVDSIYYCPYCFFKGDSSESLVKHYEIHQHDKYQCGYCFYRSAIDQSCWEHVKSHHSQYPLIVYDCPLEPCLDASSKAASDRLHRKRECFVRPLICTCKLIIYYWRRKVEQICKNYSNEDTEKKSCANYRFLFITVRKCFLLLCFFSLSTWWPRRFFSPITNKRKNFFEWRRREDIFEYILSEKKKSKIMSTDSLKKNFGRGTFSFVNLFN